MIVQHTVIGESMTRERILIIEDEARIAQFLERGLIYEGFKVSVAADGQNGLTMARDNSPDLVILDWMIAGAGWLGSVQAPESSR